MLSHWLGTGQEGGGLCSNAAENPKALQVETQLAALL